MPSERQAVTIIILAAVALVFALLSGPIALLLWLAK